MNKKIINLFLYKIPNNTNIKSIVYSFAGVFLIFLLLNIDIKNNATLFLVLYSLFFNFLFFFYKFIKENDLNKKILLFTSNYIEKNFKSEKMKEEFKDGLLEYLKRSNDDKNL